MCMCALCVMSKCVMGFYDEATPRKRERDGIQSLFDGLKIKCNR